MNWEVESEFGILQAVLLSRPDHYRWFASCDVASTNIANGRTLDVPAAREQHRKLAAKLEAEGVRCHYVPPAASAPDLVYMWDTALVTPWGAVILRPSASHRRAESDRVACFLRTSNTPIVGTITRGGLEGGDICLVKPGTVLVGCSGERSTRAGAEELAELFVNRGWEAIIHRFEPKYLHLDTLVGVLGPDAVLACTEVLEDSLIAALRERDFSVLPVTLEESRRLACNLLALGAGRVLMSAGNDRVREMIVAAGFRAIETDIDQFTRAGGGIHCLTLPLVRAPGR
jgi:N-dimethylarginine dimethylaminohydrolase